MMYQTTFTSNFHTLIPRYRDCYQISISRTIHVTMLTASYASQLTKQSLFANLKKVIALERLQQLAVNPSVCGRGCIQCSVWPENRQMHYLILFSVV
jgi:hypothetical protein